MSGFPSPSPMSKAPKDGTQVLAMLASGQTILVAWSEEWKLWQGFDPMRKAQVKFTDAELLGFYPKPEAA